MVFKGLKKFYQFILLLGFVSVFFSGVLSCSSDNPEPEQPTNIKPDFSNKKGEVTFAVDLPQDFGNGTPSSPVELNKSGSLDITIRQKSSYEDPNGTTFSCEPKASIKFSVEKDTIFAKDIESLKEVSGVSDTKTFNSGNDLVCSNTVQTFDICGQKIVFDLSHEIFTYLNSEKDKIEMPYIKVNPARIGGNVLADESLETRSATVVTGVTVRPISKINTRSIIMRDSTLFDVNVRFSINLESVGSQSESNQTLEFSVDYIGVVETITELPDPIAGLSYVWDIKKGTNSSTSPFVKTMGATMELQILQTSTYTDEYGNGAVSHPKAFINISVAKDTVWMKNVDDLKNFKDISDVVPSGQAALQKFGSAWQTVEIEWGYENCEVELAGRRIEMPFYSLSPVKIKDLKVTDISSKNKAATYEIIATFSQNVTVQNISMEPSELELEYVVKYIGAELKNPIAEISHEWNVNGTMNKDSRFVKNNCTDMNIIMTQTSSYIDEYGDIVTMHPKATIKVSSSKDTVWVRNVDELKVVKDITDKKPTGMTGVQNFGSDLLNINFAWNYEEVETEIKGSTIQMPYYSLSPVGLKSVNVMELPDGVVDGKQVHLYEVTVAFSQKAIANNVTEKVTDIDIEYFVKYIGVRLDPKWNLSYEWKVSGTKSIQSPFVKANGKDMEIIMAQTSSYTDEYGDVFIKNPKASIKVYTSKDTVWVKNIDELKVLQNNTSSLPSGLSSMQEFCSDLQSIKFEWNYENAESEISGKTIQMPYYSLKPVVLNNISIKELSDGIVAGKQADLYEVTATFSQQAVANNVMDLALDIDIEYVVKYIGAIEVHLTNIEYYPMGHWEDPHDNIMLCYRPKVERYRTYSNGKRIGPDEFFDYGHFTWSVSGTTQEDYDIRYVGNNKKEWFKYYPATKKITGDSIYLFSRSIEVSALGNFVTTESKNRIDKSGFDESLCYNDSEIPQYKWFENNNYPSDNSPTGWYFCDTIDQQGYFIEWVTPEDYIRQLDKLTCSLCYAQQYLVIDGIRIDFTKLENLKIDRHFTVEDFKETRKEGKVFKYEMKAHHLGKNFYCEHVDSVYVSK